jgi:hypothetical protein
MFTHHHPSHHHSHAKPNSTGMSRERAKELLPVIQAFAEGKTIQCKIKDSNTETWDDIEYPHWRDGTDYRIKQ